MRKFSFTWVILAALFAAITSCGPTCELLSIDTRYFDTKAIEAKVKAESVESKIYSVEAPSRFEFSLKNTYGSVRISGTSKNEISLRAEKAAWGGTYEEAQKILDKLEIVYDKRRDRLNVEARIPRQEPYSGQVKFPQINFIISLPEALKRVYVKSIYGNIDVDASGNIEISTTHGGIDIKAKDSEVAASSDYGRIRLQLVSPHQVKARTGYGSIDAELEEVQNVEVVAEGRKGQVHLSGFDKVEKEKFASLESTTAILGDGEKKLEFKSQYGRVDVRVRE